MVSVPQLHHPIVVPAVMFLIAIFVMPETRHHSTWEEGSIEAARSRAWVASDPRRGPPKPGSSHVFVAGKNVARLGCPRARRRRDTPAGLVSGPDFSDPEARLRSMPIGTIQAAIVHAGGGVEEALQAMDAERGKEPELT